MQLSTLDPLPEEPGSNAASQPQSTGGAWWSRTGSNRRPPACKAGALPIELRPHPDRPSGAPPSLGLAPIPEVVGLDGFEPSTPALSRRCSNQLSYRPNVRFGCLDFATDRRGRWPRREGFSRLGTASSLIPDPWPLIPDSEKGGDPAAPSDTATLLRLHPSHESHRGRRAPCGYATCFW